MKLLFLCNQGKNRSKLADEIFSKKYETQSAGFFNNMVTKNQFEWADNVFVMEERMISEIAKKFPKQYLQKRIINLDVPDIYDINSDIGKNKLADILEQKVNQYLWELEQDD